MLLFDAARQIFFPSCPGPISKSSQCTRHLHQSAHLDPAPHSRTGPLVKLVHRAELDNGRRNRLVLLDTIRVGGTLA